MSNKPKLIDAGRLGPVPWREMAVPLQSLALGLVLGLALIGLDLEATNLHLLKPGQVMGWGPVALALGVGASALLLPARRHLLLLAGATLAILHPFLSANPWAFLSGVPVLLAFLVFRIPAAVRIVGLVLFTPFLLQIAWTLGAADSNALFMVSFTGALLGRTWFALPRRSPWRAVPYLLTLVLAMVLTGAGLLGMTHPQIGRSQILVPGLVAAGLVAAYWLARFWKTDAAADAEAASLAVGLSAKATIPS